MLFTVEIFPNYPLSHHTDLENIPSIREYITSRTPRTRLHGLEAVPHSIHLPAELPAVSFSITSCSHLLFVIILPFIPCESFFYLSSHTALLSCGSIKFPLEHALEFLMVLRCHLMTPVGRTIHC
jgi:hypothetical protein